ncbi:Flavin-dependent monooxygenase, oxygenase subunit HsaA [Arthrobacter sp. SO3]|nr:Flavin-dependent monooxygenase, oxygenase subunit HsaA [Arthrobacter sp. SO3]
MADLKLTEHTIGATTVRLLSNNPDKAAQLTAHGIDVTEQLPTGVHLSPANRSYLTAKRDHTGHTLDLPADAGPWPEARPARTSGAAATNIGPAATVPTHDDMLGRIDGLIPRLRERAEEAERLRHIPESTMEDLKDAGIFHLLSPKAVGGFGLGVGTYAQAVRRLARGCASTAWTAGHLIEHVWMLARWPREVQDEVFAKGPAPLAAATGAPAGVAEKVPGGYAVSGLWSFASGVMHSGWVLLAAQHDNTRLQCLVPISDVELLDVCGTRPG